VVRTRTETTAVAIDECVPSCAAEIKFPKDSHDSSQSRLLNERHEARSHLYSLETKPLREIDQWLVPYRVFLSARLHQLTPPPKSQGADT
jgi:hypothetical protein